MVPSATLRLAWKVVRSRAGTTTFIVALSVGVGLALTTYTLLASVARVSLPYGDSEGLVRVWSRGGTSESIKLLNVAHLQLLTASASPLEHATPFVRQQQRLQLSAQRSTVVSGAQVGATLFELLRVKPVRGVTLSDAQGGGVPPVVVSERLVRAGLVPEGLGSIVTLDGQKLRVVGIMAPTFWFPDRSADYWTTLSVDVAPGVGAGAVSLPVVARLGQGVSLASGRSEAAVRLRTQGGVANEDAVAIEPLRSILQADLDRTLTVLTLAAGVLVLLVAVNLAWLSLSLADRLTAVAYTLRSIGAPVSAALSVYLSVRCFQLLLAVPCVVTSAWLLLESTRSLHFSALSAIADPRVTLHVVIVGVASTLSLGALVSAPGAIRMRRFATASAPGSGDRRTHSGRHPLARNIAVGVQVALVCILAALATSLAGGVRSATAINVGYPNTDFLVMPMVVLDTSQAAPADLAGRFAATLEALDAKGIRAAVTNVLPLTSSDARTVVGAPGVHRRDWDVPVRIRLVSAGYFDVTGIAARTGRLLGPLDRGAHLAVVNQAFVNLLFQGQSPIGVRVTEWAPWVPWLSSLTFVGTVDNMRQLDLSDAEIPEVYVLYDDYVALREEQALSQLGAAVFMALPGNSPSATTTVLRDTAQTYLPSAEFRDVTAMADLVAEHIGVQRFVGAGSLLLGVVALLLVAVGVYGLLNEEVTRRVRENGIRAALGAPPSSLALGLIGPPALALLLGLIVGLVLVELGQQLVQAMFALPPTIEYPSPVGIAGLVGVVVVGSMALACAVPLRRVLRTNPADAMNPQ